MEDIRILELLSDILIEHKETNKRLQNVENRLEKLDEQQFKTNLAIGELRLSVMRLADKIELIGDLEKRVLRIEETLFHA